MGLTNSESLFLLNFIFLIFSSIYLQNAQVHNKELEKTC